MKFKEKHNNEIELHLDLSERELVYNALRNYSAYGESHSYLLEQVSKICEMMNVLDSPAIRLKP